MENKESKDFRSKPVMGPDGKMYPSQKVLAFAYGKSPQLVFSRVKYGWSLEKALTYPVQHHEKWVGLKGETYRSAKEMTAAYGIDLGHFWYLKKLGVPVCEILKG